MVFRGTLPLAAHWYMASFVPKYAVVTSAAGSIKMRP